MDGLVAIDFPEYPSSAKPMKHRLRADSTPERISSKRKGNVKNYYECVICDLGGDLLCCDSCPFTYHTECLSLPLTRTSSGKWICQNCFLKNDELKPANRLAAIAKQLRTKTSERISQGGEKCERASHIYCSSIISGEQYSEKDKSLSAEESKSNGNECSDAESKVGSQNTKTSESSRKKKKTNHLTLRSLSKTQSRKEITEEIKRSDLGDESVESRKLTQAEMDEISKPSVPLKKEHCSGLGSILKSGGASTSGFPGVVDKKSLLRFIIETLKVLKVEHEKVNECIAAMKKLNEEHSKELNAIKLENEGLAVNNTDAEIYRHRFGFCSLSDQGDTTSCSVTFPPSSAKQKIQEMEASIEDSKAKITAMEEDQAEQAEYLNSVTQMILTKFPDMVFPEDED